MTQHLRCPNCGTIFDVSRYAPGHRFKCSCGFDLTVGTSHVSSVGAMPATPPPPGPDPGLEPIVKVLVFLANMCFPFAWILSLIVYFVIKDQKPRTASDLCKMTWIPFVVGLIL